MHPIRPYPAARTPPTCWGSRARDGGFPLPLPAASPLLPGARSPHSLSHPARRSEDPLAPRCEGDVCRPWQLLRHSECECAPVESAPLAPRRSPGAPLTPRTVDRDGIGRRIGPEGSPHCELCLPQGNREPELQLVYRLLPELPWWTQRRVG